MPDAKEAYVRLIKAFPELPSASMQPLSRVIASLSGESTSRLHSTEFLNEEAFNYMRAFILTHHGMSQRPLQKENFEYAVEYIFRRQGRHVPTSTDPTRRGADIMIDGVTYSLKTHSSDGNKTPSTFDISKFAESRWLREPLLNEDFTEILRLVKNSVQTHLNEYSEIIFLHNHTTHLRGAPVVSYRLYKVPKWIFELTYKLTQPELVVP